MESSPMVYCTIVYQVDGTGQAAQARDSILLAELLLPHAHRCVCRHKEVELGLEEQTIRLLLPFRQRQGQPC